MARFYYSLILLITATECLNAQTTLRDPTNYRVGTAKLDAQQKVVLEDLTPHDLQKENKRLIQLTLQPAITILKDKNAADGLKNGGKPASVELSLKEVTYLVTTGHYVNDFLPNKTLVPSGKGIIAVSKTSDKSTSSRGYAYIIIKTPGIEAKGEIEVNATTQKRVKIEYSKIPPKELLTSSNIIEGGRGVSFTLNKTKQVDISGQHYLNLLLVVPSDFTADYITIKCLATIEIKLNGTQFGGSSSPNRGGSRQQTIEDELDIAVYTSGHERGEKAVEQFLRDSTTPATEPILPSETAPLRLAKMVATAARDKALRNRGFISRRFDFRVARHFYENVESAKRNLANPQLYVGRLRARTVIRQLNGH